MNVEWWFWPVAYAVFGIATNIGVVLNRGSWELMNDKELGPSLGFWLVMHMIFWPLLVLYWIGDVLDRLMS